MNTLKNKKILIIGGTGSLGYKLCERYIKDNKIFIFSRDECKHWKMSLYFSNNKNLNFVIGNIRDKHKIYQSLIRVKPNIIIIAAALKHIDKCENETNECINTNIIGIQNILDVIEMEQIKLLPELKSVCFISTDKACSPVNIYGMCKAISEKLIIEKAFFIKKIKFICVRYGNVLNSRGSIIPILNEMGKDSNVKQFKLTHKDMTRFIMTLEQSVDLIENAIIYSESGDIVIPELVSCNIKHLIEIFSEKYNKPIIVSGLRPGEKMLESLINETQSMRLVQKEKYNYIKPIWNCKIKNVKVKDYNSKINPLSKTELKKYFEKLKLI